MSPEAPVPVFVPLYEETRSGMAQNVANNLKKLNSRLVEVYGEKSTKIRFIDKRSKQHIMRLDVDAEQQSFSDFDIINDKFNAIVISDYNKGLLTYDNIVSICKKYNGPIFIDTKKKDLAKFNFSNVFIKINSVEDSAATTKGSNVIVTMGKEGAMYNGSVYPTPDIEVADVCGAGDTFLAALATEYLKTNNIDQAIHFANVAASITVQHVGTYAPTLEEINEIRGIR